MTPATLVALATLAAAPCACAGNALVADLEQRLAADGVDQANSHLVAHWPTKMLPLNRQTADCDLGAVRVALALSQGTVAKATQAHVEALRVAGGGCARFVLALAPPGEIPRYCASVSTWTLGQTARELRRRIAAIDADELLSTTQSGKTCRAAYAHELRSTRVVLKKKT